MPGPLLTITVSESTKRGAVAGPLVIFGHTILELLLVLLLLAGLAPLLTRDDVFIAISLAGGCILLWMAYGMFRELPSLRLKTTTGDAGTKNLVLAGILLSIANPYWTIWWATIGIGYIAYSVKFGILGVAAFFIGHILADLAWYSMISFGIAKGRHFFNDTFYRRLIGCCAVFLAVFSCYFFYSGIQRMI